MTSGPFVAVGSAGCFVLWMEEKFSAVQGWAMHRSFKSVSRFVGFDDALSHGRVGCRVAFRMGLLAWLPMRCPADIFLSSAIPFCGDRPAPLAFGRPPPPPPATGHRPPPPLTCSRFRFWLVSTDGNILFRCHLSFVFAPPSCYC